MPGPDKPSYSAAKDPLAWNLIERLFAPADARVYLVSRWFEEVAPEDAARLMVRVRSLGAVPVGDLEFYFRAQLGAGEQAKLLEQLSRRMKAAERGTANPGTGNRMTAPSNRGIDPEPRMTKRCLEYSFTSVPDTFEAFEAAIIKWMASCVVSRTNNAHREVTLVKGNQSLAAVWDQLTPGQPARIIPKYIFGPHRTEAIEFSTPDGAKQVRGATRKPSAFQVLENAERVAIEVIRASKRTFAVDDIVVERPDREATHDPALKPRFPNDFEGLLDDLRRLVELLRDNGRDRDARSLEELIEKGANLLASLALLVGAYYVGLRIRNGVLLFVWGWTLSGDARARRSFARLERLKGEVEDWIAKVSVATQQHEDLISGSVLPWRMIGGTADPTVVTQFEDVACGPASAQMVLADRGILVDQVEIATHAREHYPRGYTKAGIRDTALVGVLRDYDPDGAWQGGFLQIPGATTKQLVKALNSTGSWIAWVWHEEDKYFHSIVIDGLTRAGSVLVRDPWGISTRVPTGARYRVSWAQFERHWSGIGFFRTRQGP